MNIFTNQYGELRWTTNLLMILGITLGLWAAFYYGVGALAHIQTGTGQQSGTVVAVDSGGVLWKTTTVYLKTDPYASDTDPYCVVDPAVKAHLHQAMRDRSKVIITYTEHVSWSEGCGWSYSETIRSVQVMA